MNREILNKEFNKKHDIKCECDFCKLSALRKEALRSNDIIFIKKVLEEFADRWINLDFDKCYYEALLSGDWPNSEEILTKVLNNIKGKNDEKKHRREE